MTVDLEHELRRVARVLEDAAPAISLDELRPSASTGSDHDLLAGKRSSRRRAGVAWSVAAAAVVAVVIGVAVTAGEPSIRTGSDLPAPSDTASPTPAVVASVDTPAESTTPVSTAPASSSTVTETSPAGQLADVADTPIRLAEVAERSARALVELDSFRAVATITQRTEPAETTQPAEVSTRTNTISLFGDGRMWASTDTGGWASFDPSTGTSRVAVVNDDGTTTYQEILGWSDNTVGLNVLVGHDPVPRFDTIDPAATVTVVDHDARPAWQIAWHGTLGTDGSVAQTVTIDQTTGLVVATSTESTIDGTRQVTESSLTEVTAGIELPAEYPGSFPPDAAVERSGDPAAFRSVSVAEAAAAFGDGLAVPAELPDTARITISTQPVTGESIDGEEGEVFATDVGVTITIPEGFARTIIEYHKFRPVPGVTPGFGMIPADDGLCFTGPDGGCSTTDSPTVFAAGALAGQPYETQGAGTAISINTGNHTLYINAPTIEHALTTASGLVPAD
jgi:hypothetical protein